MRRAIIVAFGLSAVIMASLWYAAHFIRASYGYQVEAVVTTVPPDDKVLQEWLLAQPGVHSAWVEREQAGSGTRVIISVGMAQDGWGHPPFPDIGSKCIELGYLGHNVQFRDCLR